jgi:hypothetical protein
MGKFVAGLLIGLVVGLGAMFAYQGRTLLVTSGGIWSFNGPLNSGSVGGPASGSVGGPPTGVSGNTLPLPQTGTTNLPNATGGVPK